MTLQQKWETNTPCVTRCLWGRRHHTAHILGFHRAFTGSWVGRTGILRSLGKQECLPLFNTSILQDTSMRVTWLWTTPQREQISYLIAYVALFKLGGRLWSEEPIELTRSTGSQEEELCEALMSVIVWVMDLNNNASTSQSQYMMTPPSRPTLDYVQDFGRISKDISNMHSLLIFYSILNF